MKIPKVSVLIPTYNSAKYLVLLFFAPRRIYTVMVFFLLFSATIAINIGHGEKSSGLRSWMFFGIVWRLIGSFVFTVTWGLLLVAKRNYRLGIREVS